MNVRCSCGGRFRRTDIVPVVVAGITMYKDLDDKVAHWKCDRCSALKEQKKRQRGKQPTAVLAHRLEVAYYISDERYVYGPFPTLSDAECWIEAPHATFGDVRYFSLGKLQRIGHPGHADSVGLVYPEE